MFRLGSLVAAPVIRRAFAWMLCLASSMGLACGGNRMIAVEAGEARPLAEGEAYLILHVDTDVDLEGVSLHAGRVADELPKGDHIWIVRTRAREGGWERVDFGPEYGRRAHVDLETWRYGREGEYLFEIEAGSINYPGTLIVRTELLPGVKFGGNAVSVRNRNHSARAVRRLLEMHPELLRSIPLRYAGTSGDTFLEHYTMELKRIGRQEASPSE